MSKLKTKTITLSYPHFDNSKNGGTDRFNAPRVYEVKSLTDSVEFIPGQQLSKKEVELLCSWNDWKVSIVKA